MTRSLETVKAQIEAGNKPKIAVVAAIPGGKSHIGEAKLMIHKGMLVLSQPFAFCGSQKFGGLSLSALKCTGIQKVNCQKCARSEYNLDEMNAEYLEVLKYLGEKI